MQPYSLNATGHAVSGFSSGRYSSTFHSWGTLSISTFSSITLIMLPGHTLNSSKSLCPLASLSIPFRLCRMLWTYIERTYLHSLSSLKWPFTSHSFLNLSLAQSSNTTMWPSRFRIERVNLKCSIVVYADSSSASPRKSLLPTTWASWPIKYFLLL